MRDSVLGMIRMLETQPRAAHAMLDFFTNPEGNDLREQRLERTRRAIDADAARRLYELSFETDITDDLRALPMPTLVLHRKRTQAIPFVHGQHVAALVARRHLRGRRRRGPQPLGGRRHAAPGGDGPLPR